MTLAVEGQLGTVARGSLHEFGTARLAIDDASGILVVGGQVIATGAQGFLKGGGLAWLDLSTGKLAGLSTSNSDIVGEHVTAIEYDPQTKRTYAALRQRVQRAATWQRRARGDLVQE